MSAYGRLCTVFYDLDKPVAPADAVAYYGRRALDAAGPALEPMCGSGRFLLPLLAQGVAVDGVDASAEMLAACRRRGAVLGLSPVLYCQQLARLALPKRYALAFVPSGSFGLIEHDAEIRASLEALRRHLLPGASLLVELLRIETAGAGAMELEPRAVSVDADTRIEYRCRAQPGPDGRTIRYAGRYELRRLGELLACEDETLALRLHTAEQALELLATAGFRDGRVVAPTAAMSWLHDGDCELLEAVAPP